MQFEDLMRQLFGEKAYGIAGGSGNDRFRKRWLIQASRLMQKIVVEIDTTPRHQRMLSIALEDLEKSFQNCREPTWEIVYKLLLLCSRLLGYDYCIGSAFNTPLCYQTEAQHYGQLQAEGADALSEHIADQKNALTLRIARELKAKGHTIFKIVLVLNTSEYQIKKLLKSY